MANQHVLRRLRRHRSAVATLVASTGLGILALIAVLALDDASLGLILGLGSLQASILGLGLNTYKKLRDISRAQLDLSVRVAELPTTVKSQTTAEEIQVSKEIQAATRAIQTTARHNSWRNYEWSEAIDQRLKKHLSAIEASMIHNSWRSDDYLAALEAHLAQHRVAVQSTVRHNSWRHSEWTSEVDRHLEPLANALAELTPSEPKQHDRELTPSEALSTEGWIEPSIDSRPLTLAIMDEFTEGCFSQDLNLIQPRPDNWLALTKKYQPELIFIESAWKGKGRSWQYRVGNYSVSPGSELQEMTKWARKNEVPSVFWNKEDPVHHDKFMKAAKSADHIFTTDANLVDSYKKKTGNPSVHALPFAAQPAIHRPRPLEGRISKAAFAGSWYGNRHAERGHSMQWLLESALEPGLDIFDRNHGTGTFPFPEQFSSSVRGGLPYLELCREYAKYRVFLNVNSVTNSPTMFSRRVFELMASGTPVISTYALGIEELFSEDSVWLVDSADEARDALDVLLGDDAEWRRRSLAGIREVFSNHTYAHRTNTIFEIAGLGKRITTDPSVTLRASVNNDTDLANLQHFAENQTYRNFKIIAESSSNSSSVQLDERITVVAPGMARVLFDSAERDGMALVGKWSARHRYGCHYLRDLVNASHYQPGAAGWGKSLETDAFSYHGARELDASIWRSDIFDQAWSGSDEHLVAHGGLFLADSSEFFAGSDL